MQFFLCVTSTTKGDWPDLIVNKFVSTEKLDYVCEDSKFCNSAFPSSGTIICGSDGSWNAIPNCNQSTILDEGVLIFEIFLSADFFL